jgi:hypothetical protein
MSRIRPAERDVRRSPRGPLLVLACLAAVVFLAQGSVSQRGVVEDHFSGRDGLIANENARAAATSRTWRVTSGSLFRRHGWGWTGRPDGGSPDPCSCRANGSAVFRMTTRRRDLGDVTVSFALRTLRLTSTDRTPPRPWDGVHLMLRWQSPQNTYYVTVNRRDGEVVIKRKVPGGPANGGTYFDVGHSARFPVRYGTVQHVRAAVVNGSDGSVKISLFVDGEKLLEAVDRGTGAGPIRSPGAIGFRADNAEILLDDVRVSDRR